MQKLIGKKISLQEKISLNKSELEASCAKLSEEIGTRFEVNIERGREPCPFYCSNIDKPFDLDSSVSIPAKFFMRGKK